MARAPEKQVSDIEAKINLTEDYIRRLKKRVRMLEGRLQDVRERHGLAQPAPTPAAAQEDEAPALPVGAEGTSSDDSDI
jgi:phage shock protein A